MFDSLAQNETETMTKVEVTLLSPRVNLFAAATRTINSWTVRHDKTHTEETKSPSRDRRILNLSVT